MFPTYAFWKHVTCSDAQPNHHLEMNEYNAHKQGVIVNPNN